MKKTQFGAVLALGLLLSASTLADEGTWVDPSPQGNPTRVQLSTPQGYRANTGPAREVIPPAHPLGLVVKHAWIDPAPEGGRAYVHFTVENVAGRDMMLTGVSSPLAQRTVVQLILKNNQGQFRAADALPIPLPAGEEKVFSPHTLAVDMAGLKAPIEVGAEFPLTLTLENGDNQTYRIPVGPNFQR